MHHLLRRASPQAARHLLDAADDPALVLVAIGDDDAQDLQHRVGIVGVPAAGAEADLAEDLAMPEGAPGERLRGGDEVIEAAIVPQRHQLVPDLLERLHVAGADRLLHGAEMRAVLQRLAPGGRDFLKDRRQVGELLGVIGLAFEVDDGRGRGRDSGLGNGFDRGRACRHSGRSRCRRPGNACRPVRRRCLRAPSKLCERSRPPIRPAS